MNERPAGQSTRATDQSVGPAAGGRIASPAKESPQERRDRNWTELLQELWVA